MVIYNGNVNRQRQIIFPEENKLPRDGILRTSRNLSKYSDLTVAVIGCCVIKPEIV